MKKIRKLVPQKAINIGKHLPLAIYANVKYGFPSRGMKVIGVTGTDGKTTTTTMIYSILKEAGKKVAMISTINAVIDGKSYDTGFHVTSPDPLTIQRYIKQAKDQEVEYLVLEITSHAIDQYRGWGITFDIGVITNITHEHLDYHKTFENYRNTKAKLIENVRVAVLNSDDNNFSFLKKIAKGKVVTFGLSKDADINSKNLPLKLKLPGDYNKLNALAAASVALELGIGKQVVKQALENINEISGRMEEVKNKKGIKIYVDFAHTPNALEQALKTLKPMHGHKLISVFGAAAERDREKRPLMGKISGRYADITILTDEDPRFEDREKIIDEIAQGCYAYIKDGNGKELYREPDRTKAIKLAILKAKKGDVVGIFGKGHERSMNYKGIEKAWSDTEAVMKALSGR